MLRLLCKLSLEPTTCVRRTQDSFGRRREVMLTFAKFVPGLAMLTPPVAGQNGMNFGRFLFFDGIGASLWVGTLLTVGRLFGDALKRDPGLLNWVGRFSGALLLLGIIGFFVVRLLRRRAVLKRLAASRLEPEELKQAARCRRAGLYCRPAPPAGTAAGPLHSARRAALLAR